MEGNPVISEEERQLLRDSVRRFLEARWPVEGAVERATSADAVHAIWGACADQGLAALGKDPSLGGLRAILLVFEELGRANCPAPLAGAVAANLLLAEHEEARDLLDSIHAGTSAVSIALGAFDGDAAAGGADYANGSLNGTVRFVEDAAAASHVLVFTGDPPGAAIVAADGTGVEIVATPGLAVPSLSEVHLATQPMSFVLLDADKISDVALMLRLATAARAMGAARRAFDLALDHARLRHQFGQAIGSFQALQHKLANCLISLEGAALTLDDAAATCDRGDDAWRVFANAALAFCGSGLRQVMLEAHHALGAIGYAEEHEAPRHFRRVHADLVRFGGAPRARAALADALLGPIERA